MGDSATTITFASWGNVTAIAGIVAMRVIEVIHAAEADMWIYLLVGVIGAPNAMAQGAEIARRIKTP